MNLHSFESLNEQDTVNFAQECAKSAKKNDVFLLQGPLGAGKSIFARAFIQYFIGQDTEIPSPTFTLVQTYITDEAEMWHFDLYRLDDPEEIYELGWEEAHGQNLLLIEWPERLGHLKPHSYKQITITPNRDESRNIEFQHVKGSASS